VSYVGLLLPASLLFISVPPKRDRQLLPPTWFSWLTLPYSRLYDAMGEDMQDWVDVRLQAASAKPQWIADAVNYYYGQLQGRLKNAKVRADLDDWRKSITHKISIVRLISLDTTPARLRASLQMHSSTQDMRQVADDDLRLLARRLEGDALRELNLFLVYVYRQGYYRLPIYPFKQKNSSSLGIGGTANRARSSGDNYR
jgi:hypothetical protein